MNNYVSSVHGIILVDKPYGLSSNQALQAVKKIYQVKKAGHTGSLDPMATGLLPICLNEATKISQFLLEADKGYYARACLGRTTDTGDATGRVTNITTNFKVSEARLSQTLKRFVGLSLQIPSMFSALKHQGVPLYKIARKGITIDRSSRSITIHQLTLLDFDGIEFEFTVDCSKGTYVRTLVEDIGQQLGCGAHLTALRRYKTGSFADSMYTVDQLGAMTEKERNAVVLSADLALIHLSLLTLGTEEVQAISQGKTLTIAHNFQKDTVFRLYAANKIFFGLGQAVNTHQIKAKRLFAPAFY